MDLKLIKQKVDFVAWIMIFCWVMFTLGSQLSLKETCKHYNSSLYHYAIHDFKTVKQFNQYHCLREIPTPVCFAGQKQILFYEKCTINEELGGKYGYLTK